MSNHLQKLIEQAKRWKQFFEIRPGVLTIQADEIVGKVISFYERVRRILDWREQHLVRRNALERILKRRFFLKNNVDAEEFILEVIQAGYFPNNQIPRSKTQEVKRIFEKYFYILSHAQPPKSKNRGQFYHLILDIASCEIESTLDPASYFKNDSLIEFMESFIKERILIGKKILGQGLLTEEEKFKQIYIAVQQALLKYDKPLIVFNLLRREHSDWSSPSPEKLEQITQNLHFSFSSYENSLDSPLANKFYNLCEKYDTIYLLIGDVIFGDPAKVEENISHPEIFERLIRKNYERRLSTLKIRMTAAAFFSTLSIFLSKVLVLYALEIPLEKAIGGNFNILAQTVDVLVPMSLMFILITSIRLPRDENLATVIKEVRKIVYPVEERDIYEVDIQQARQKFLKIFTQFLYSILSLSTFGGIIYVLFRLHFSILSMIIFLIFASMTSFTGVILRKRARELTVIEKKESLSHLVIYPIALPLVYLGKWLAARWEKINILSVIFDYLIETPFFGLVSFLKYWRNLLKEKKDSLR